MKSNTFLPSLILSASIALNVPALAGDKLCMPLVTFDGDSVPVNRAGDSYPSEYRPQGSAQLSLDAADAVSGKCLHFEVTKGVFYSQFNPYNEGAMTRSFARDYALHPDQWRMNTYNRMSFWIKIPANAASLKTDGRPNTHVGTYVKRIAHADVHSDEAGGFHGYHYLNLPNTNTWTKVVINMHPNHTRATPGGIEEGNRPHPTAEPNYNYFDTMTRFYVSQQLDAPTSYPAMFAFDDFQFYQESAEENDEQVYGIAATVVPGTKTLIMTWNRDKNENTVRHEVRYAFSNIHDLGWNRATPAPGGTVAPRGWQGYNGMLYTTNLLPLAGKKTLFLAIKPANSQRFSQIELPLTIVK